MSVSPAGMHLVRRLNEIRFPRVAQLSKPNLTLLAFAMFCRFTVYVKINWLMMSFLFSLDDKWMNKASFLDEKRSAGVFKLFTSVW